MAAAQTPHLLVTSYSSYSNCFMKLIGANFFVGCLKTLFKNLRDKDVDRVQQLEPGPDRGGPWRLNMS